MGESAKILSPNKTILMPSLDSGCAMADMINEGEIIEFKNKYKDAYISLLYKFISNSKSTL